MQFITTIPMLTNEKENRAWHISIKSRGSCFHHKAKKNKLFDCPLITFQRVGRSVGIFFFFFFFLLSAHLAVLLPGHALVPGFSSLLEHVMSSPVNTSTIKSNVLTLFSLVFGPSVTSIAIANANSLGDVIAMPSLSSTDKQRIDCVFFFRIKY